jgi:hypothetical protein
MRVEVGTSRPAPGRDVVGRNGHHEVSFARPRRRLDWFESTLLCAFAAVSVWVIALDLWQVVVNGRVWTGTDGFYVVDQMQYLAWIRSISHHLLASNMFVLHPTPADYFQPALLISGALTALGVAPAISFLLWKPIAVLAAFFAIRAYMHRSLRGLWQRRAALALALFFGSFTVIYGSFGVVGDLFPGFLSWGYTFALLAVAALPAAVLSYDRSRSRARVWWVPGLLGAVASSLHPWQGELLILIVVAGELIVRRQRSERLLGRLALPGLTIALTAAPLVYYAALGRWDSSWSLAREASKHNMHLWTVLLAILPLLIPAALAYRQRARTFLEVATRLWPPAALVIYVLSATELSATPLHAFNGVTIPLSVLAVEGACAIRWRWRVNPRLIGALAVGAATIPTTVYELSNAQEVVQPSIGNANFISKDENTALHYLAKNRRPGGVLTRFYLGTIVPEKTGRPTYVGHCMWSQPDCSDRSKEARYLLDGLLRPSEARSFVASTGAQFVLADCRAADLHGTLGPLVANVQHFGCATVYELKSRATVPDPPPQKAL